MSRKILSIVLAVVMLFSFCAVAANAAVAAGKSIGIKVVTDATTSTKAGDTVKVKVYYTVPDESQDYFLQNGPIAVAWNSEAFAPKTTSTNNTITDCRTWGASYVNVMKTTCAVSKATSATIISTHYANVTDTYGWNAACRVVLTMDTAAGYTTATGFQIDPDCELFTMEFVAQRDITSADVIGIPYGTYGDANLKINERIAGSTTPSLYPSSEIDWSTAATAPNAPSYDVYHIAAKNGDAKTRTNADDANKYDIGVKFGFKTATIAANFDKNGTSANITDITATVTANLAAGGTSTVSAEPIRFVYDLSGGAQTELGFNVIIAGIPNGDTAVTSYTITPSITTEDGGTYTCETKTITVADLKFAA